MFPDRLLDRRMPELLGGQIQRQGGLEAYRGKVAGKLKHLLSRRNLLYQERLKPETIIAKFKRVTICVENAFDAIALNNHKLP